MKGGSNLKDYFSKVYELVEKIPLGKVATYGQIARILGDKCNARVVGWAMKGAPSNLPCHRVVNRLGEMAPGHVFGSKELQKDILEFEGITFLSSGCIDMKKHLWEGPDK
jgi:methylated-DNA-protein-cysteine methyltransferase related protein